MSYDDFQRLKLHIVSPLSATNFPGIETDLVWGKLYGFYLRKCFFFLGDFICGSLFHDPGPLPTLDDLKEFMDESPYKLKDSWSLIKNTSAENVLQNARILISNGLTNSQSYLNSPSTQIKKKRLKISAFITKQGNFVGGGTNDVLNALAAYLKYLEGTARDDWQEYVLFCSFLNN